MQISHDNINHWSTDCVASVDRFAYWRETLCANMIGDTPEAPAGHRDDFEGEISRVPLADTAVMRLRMKVSLLKTERNAKDVRESPGDGIFLFRATTLPINFLFSDREGFVSPVGGVSLGGLDRERFSVPEQPGVYGIDVLRIAGASFDGVIRDPEVLEPRLLRAHDGADALLENFFHAFMRELPDLDTAERATGLDTLTNLVGLVLRRDRQGEEPVRDAVRAARLRAAQDFVVRNAANPALSPATAAAALRISIRQLQSLFEMSDRTFSQYLTHIRIAKAKQALIFHSERTVADIAFDCGFDSLPTFYRSFRAIAGMSPTELRHRAGR
jgi:AraC-like DNA-binding protein